MWLWLSLLTAALSIALLIYWLFSPVTRNTKQPADVELKSWGLLWPWIDALSLFATRFVTWSYQRTLQQEIIMAGRLDRLQPIHIVGMQLLAGIFGLLLAFFLCWEMQLEMVSTLVTCLFVTCLFAWLPRHRLRTQARARQILLLKQFPFFLDMIILCIEAGMNLHGALIQTCLLLPKGPLQRELNNALNDMRAGIPRIDAMKSMAERTGLKEIKHFVASVVQTDTLGAGLGAILRAQSEQRRNERFLKAEKLALEAPVKMLLPLVTCIFPCTFIVLAFPIGMKLLNAGI